MATSQSAASTARPTTSLAADDAGRGPVTAVTVAVCTFQRNEQLREVLPLLVQQAESLDPARYSAEVLVIDNNPSGDAAAVVAASDRPTVRYVHEPRPGLTAARNAALRHANGSLLAFIDDDEEPGDNWLAELVGAQARFGAPAVVGPILARYEGPVPGWIAAGRFFERDRFPTGTPRPAGHTSNLLLDLRFLREHGLAFRDEFGMAGGEDTMLTMELGRAGGGIIWCDEAPVTDLVPVDRMTREWVLNRRYRMGNSHSRCLLALESSAVRRLLLRVQLVLGGAARAAVGALLRALGALTGSQARDARGATLMARGAGMAAGATGRQFEEYRRSESATVAQPHSASL